MPVKHAQQGGRFQHAVCPEVQLVCGGPLKPRGYPFGKGAEAAGELALRTGGVFNVCADGDVVALGLNQFSTRSPFTMIGFPVAWEYSTSGHKSAPFGQVMEPSSGSTRT